MKFLEKNLEDIIYKTDNGLLLERGLEIYGKKIRQLRIGNYGIADLVTFEKPIYIENEYKKEHEICDFFVPTITIYELKKDEINIKTLLQSLGYANGIKNYLENREVFIGNDFFDSEVYSTSIKEFKIKIVLIGGKIAKNNNFIYLPNIFNDLSLYTYDYGLDGLNFKNIYDYKLINQGF
jgi:hypothetical protein